MAKITLEKIVITFFSFLIYGIIQDYITRNYPETNPILMGAVAGTVAMIVVIIIFRKDTESQI